MRFRVPQFIEVEDKIFGPFTLKQFIYLAGGAGFVAMLYSTLPFFFVILLGAPVVILALALAFYKVNNRSLVDVMESATRYFSGNKLYLWKQKVKKTTKKEGSKEKKSLLSVPKLSENKLKDLAWSLDIKESIYSDKAQQS
tara:strand:- start:1207 stop:1629 length:423 start_codon:yes stop_codon:yes gene_type:complete